MIKYNTNLGYFFLKSKYKNNKIYEFDKIKTLNSRKILKKCINKKYYNIIPFLERIEPFCSNHYSLCFIKAIEENNNLNIKDNILILRVIILEIERIFCNINSLKNIFLITKDFILANMCNEIIEVIHNYYETVFGHRVFHNYNTLGGFKHNFTIGNFERTINLVKILNKKINFLLDIATEIPSVKTQLLDLACIAKFSRKDARVYKPYFYYKDETIVKILKNNSFLKIFSQYLECNSAYSRFIYLIDETIKSLSILQNLSSSNATFNQHELKKAKLNHNVNFNSSIQSPRGLLNIEFETNEDFLLTNIKIQDPSSNILKKIKTQLHNILIDDVDLAINSFFISFLEIAK